MYFTLYQFPVSEIISNLSPELRSATTAELVDASLLKFSVSVETVAVSACTLFVNTINNNIIMPDTKSFVFFIFLIFSPCFCIIILSSLVFRLKYILKLA